MVDYESDGQGEKEGKLANLCGRTIKKYLSAQTTTIKVCWTYLTNCILGIMPGMMKQKE